MNSNILSLFYIYSAIESVLAYSMLYFFSVPILPVFLITSSVLPIPMFISALIMRNDKECLYMAQIYSAVIGFIAAGIYGSLTFGYGHWIGQLIFFSIPFPVVPIPFLGNVVAAQVSAMYFGFIDRDLTVEM